MACCRPRCRKYLLLFIAIVVIIQCLFVLKKNLEKGEKHIRLHDHVLKRSIKQHQQNTPTINFSLNITSSCPYLKTPKFNQASSGKWIPVGDNRELFVFSAFYEEENNEIVITGIKRGGATQASCQVWYYDGTADVVMEEISLNVKSKLPESKGLT